LAYSRSDAKQEGALDNFGGATPINLAEATGAGSSPNPNVNLQIQIPGAGFSVLNEVAANSNRLRQWNLVDTFTVAMGHHQFKAGVYYRRIASPATGQGNPNIVPLYFSTQSVLNNQADKLVVANFLSATPIFNETAAFVQDEWRVT